MDIGDEVLDLQEDDYGTLAWKNAGGAKGEAYRHLNAITVVVEDLRLIRSDSPKGPSDTLTKRLVGSVRFDDVANISVIGEAENRTKTLQLTVRGDVEELEQLIGRETDEVRKREALIPYSGVGHAFLGFNRGDWEARTNDQWFLSVTVGQPTFEAIVDALNVGQLGELRLSVSLSQLYSDKHTLAPSSGRDHLFLRPGKGDNSLDMPELAHGVLTGISLSGPSIRLSGPPQEDELPAEVATEASPAAESDVDRATAALIKPLAEISSALERLRATFKWVGGLVVVLLLVALALK